MTYNLITPNGFDPDSNQANERIHPYETKLEAVLQGVHDMAASHQEDPIRIEDSNGKVWMDADRIRELAKDNAHVDEVSLSIVVHVEDLKKEFS